MKRMILIGAALLSSLAATTASAAIAPMVSTDRTIASAVDTNGWQVAQRQISAREAKAIALSRVPGGEVVDIRRTANAYRVRIIARDGRVIDIVVDATTGRIR